MTPAQIGTLTLGDVLADPNSPDVWFVHANLPGRAGIRIIRQDGLILAGDKDMRPVLLRLQVVWRNPAAQPRPASLEEQVKAAEEERKKARRAAAIQREFEESLNADRPRRRIRDAAVHRSADLLAGLERKENLP